MALKFNKCNFYEVSAKENINVEHCFMEVTRLILQSKGILLSQQQAEPPVVAESSTSNVTESSTSEAVPSSTSPQQDSQENNATATTDETATGKAGKHGKKQCNIL